MVTFLTFRSRAWWFPPVFKQAQRPLHSTTSCGVRQGPPGAFRRMWTLRIGWPCWKRMCVIIYHAKRFANSKACKVSCLVLLDINSSEAPTAYDGFCDIHHCSSLVQSYLQRTSCYWSIFWHYYSSANPVSLSRLLFDVDQSHCRGPPCLSVIVTSGQSRSSTLRLWACSQ
jgi:hypothetical protein